MKKIGIIVAMDKEFVQLRELLSNVSTTPIHHKDFVTGTIADKEIILVQAGIGKVNAAVGTVELINAFQPDAVISSGCAGGTGPLMNVTDMVAATEMTYHDVYCGPENLSGQVQGMPVTFKGDERLLRTLSEMMLPVTVHQGLIVSGDWFVDSSEKMLQIYNDHPDAIAVDMESAAIAQVCYIYKVPFLSLRVISDMPLNENQPEQYAGFWAKLADNSFQVVKQLIEAV